MGWLSIWQVCYEWWLFKNVVQLKRYIECDYKYPKEWVRWSKVGVIRNKVYGNKTSVDDEVTWGTWIVPFLLGTLQLPYDKFSCHVWIILSSQILLHHPTSQWFLYSVKQTLHASILVHPHISPAFISSSAANVPPPSLLFSQRKTVAFFQSNG